MDNPWRTVAGTATAADDSAAYSAADSAADAADSAADRADDGADDGADDESSLAELGSSSTVRRQCTAAWRRSSVERREGR